MEFEKVGNILNCLHEHESEVEAIPFLSICVACKYKTLPKSLVLFPQDLIKNISGGGQWEESGSKDWDSYSLFLRSWVDVSRKYKIYFFHLIMSEDFKKNSENRTIELSTFWSDLCLLWHVIDDFFVVVQYISFTRGVNSRV